MAQDPATPRADPPGPIRPDAAANAVAGRAAFHALGQRVKAAMEKTGSRKAAVRQVAGEAGVPLARVKKASLFVERYRPEDLDLLGRSRTRQGRPIPVNMLMTLATVTAPEHRLRLLREIEAGAYTSSDLGDGVRRLQGGAGKTGGPRRAVPRDLAAGLRPLVKQTRSWLSLYAGIRAAEGAWLSAPTPMEDSAATRDLLAEARGLLARLAEAAAVLDRRLEAAEAGLRPPSGPDRPKS